MIGKEDLIQKTWIPEGTVEYRQFKHVTQENAKLAEILKKYFPLTPGQKILDVGGREGDISFTLTEPQFVHIVDPDPTLIPIKKPGKFWNDKVQHVELTDEVYKLIIGSHVLGYLGNQQVQKEVVERLINLLEIHGTIVLFYNLNIGYMEELLKFSKANLSKGHYDYFDEEILKQYHSPQYKIKQLDVSFQLDYSSFEELARCCWFLFGAIDQDIQGVADKFIEKLQKDLLYPSFPIEERITFIKRLS